MYRQSDLKYLQDIFDRRSNDIAVLYGNRTSGLAQILSDFIKDKECLYYRASSVNDRMQRQLFAAELHEQTRSPIFPDDDYDRLISSYINENFDRKRLIVFDDFIPLIRGNPTFINFLSGLLFQKSTPGAAMILLVCDDINWVENDMVRIVGRKSSEISGVVKLHEYSATEIREVFPQMPLSELMGIYSFLGGMSGVYDDITDKTTVKDVITASLERWRADDFNPDSFLPSDIREPVLYNTILCGIATGSSKLNDLHNLTGIDRAKLSVYIKHLINCGIVEKAVSADVGDSSGTQKGKYMISDRYTLFYYRYVFSRLSSLKMLGSERFYRKYIDHERISFVEEYYPIFCMEHVKWLMEHNMLNFRVSSIEKYYDKNDAIDFVVVAAGGSVIACACRYAPPHMSHKTLEDVKTSVRKNKLNCDNIWLFSAGGFDQKLTMSASVTPGVRLIDGADQRLR